MNVNDSAEMELDHLMVALLCRVKFDTQNSASGDDIALVKAAKSWWANSRPSFWNLVAMLVPKTFLPLLKTLAAAFPSKVDILMENSLATMYEASDALIKVSILIKSIKLRSLPQDQSDCWNIPGSDRKACLVIQRGSVY